MKTITIVWDKENLDKAIHLKRDYGDMKVNQSAADQDLSKYNSGMAASEASDKAKHGFSVVSGRASYLEGKDKERLGLKEKIGIMFDRGKDALKKIDPLATLNRPSSVREAASPIHYLFGEGTPSMPGIGLRPTGSPQVSSRNSIEYNYQYPDGVKTWEDKQPIFQNVISRLQKTFPKYEYAQVRTPTNTYHQFKFPYKNYIHSVRIEKSIGDDEVELLEKAGLFRNIIHNIGSKLGRNVKPLEADHGMASLPSQKVHDILTRPDDFEKYNDTQILQNKNTIDDDDAPNEYKPHAVNRMKHMMYDQFSDIAGPAKRQRYNNALKHISLNSKDKTLQGIQSEAQDAVNSGAKPSSFYNALSPEHTEYLQKHDIDPAAFLGAHRMLYSPKEGDTHKEAVRQAFENGNIDPSSNLARQHFDYYPEFKNKYGGNVQNVNGMNVDTSTGEIIDNDNHDEHEVKVPEPEPLPDYDISVNDLKATTGSQTSPESFDAHVRNTIKLLNISTPGFDHKIVDIGTEKKPNLVIRKFKLPKAESVPGVSGAQANPTEPQANPTEPQANPTEPQANPAEPQANPAEPQVAPPTHQYPSALIDLARQHLSRDPDPNKLANSLKIGTPDAYQLAEIIANEGGDGDKVENGRITPREPSDRHNKLKDLATRIQTLNPGSAEWLDAIDENDDLSDEDNELLNNYIDEHDDRKGYINDPVRSDVPVAKFRKHSGSDYVPPGDEVIPPFHGEEGTVPPVSSTGKNNPVYKNKTTKKYWGYLNDTSPNQPGGNGPELQALRKLKANGLINSPADVDDFMTNYSSSRVRGVSPFKTAHDIADRMIADKNPSLDLGGEDDEDYGRIPDGDDEADEAIHANADKLIAGTHRPVARNGKIEFEPIEQSDAIAEPNQEEAESDHVESNPSPIPPTTTPDIVTNQGQGSTLPIPKRVRPKKVSTENSVANEPADEFAELRSKLFNKDGSPRKKQNPELLARYHALAGSVIDDNSARDQDTDVVDGKIPVEDEPVAPSTATPAPVVSKLANGSSQAKLDALLSKINEEARDPDPMEQAQIDALRDRIARAKAPKDESPQPVGIKLHPETLKADRNEIVDILKNNKGIMSKMKLGYWMKDHGYSNDEVTQVLQPYLDTKKIKIHNGAIVPYNYEPPVKKDGKESKHELNDEEKRLFKIANDELKNNRTEKAMDGKIVKSIAFLNPQFEEEEISTPHKVNRIQHLMVSGCGHIGDEDKRKKIMAALRMVHANHGQSGIKDMLDKAKMAVQAGAKKEDFERLLSPRQSEWLVSQGVPPEDFHNAAKELYGPSVDPIKHSNDPHLIAVEDAFKNGDITEDDDISQSHMTDYPHLSLLYGKKAEQREKTNKQKNMQPPSQAPGPVEPEDREVVMENGDDDGLGGAAILKIIKIFQNKFPDKEYRLEKKGSKHVITSKSEKNKIKKAPSVITMVWNDNKRDKN